MKHMKKRSQFIASFRIFVMQINSTAFIQQHIRASAGKEKCGENGLKWEIYQTKTSEILWD